MYLWKYNTNIETAHAKRLKEFIFNLIKYHSVVADTAVIPQTMKEKLIKLWCLKI